MDEIQKIDKVEEQLGLNQELIERREELKSGLAKIIDDELFWRAHAKQHWLKERDGNMKFFHAIANERKRTNTMERVEEYG